MLKKEPPFWNLFYILQQHFVFYYNVYFSVWRFRKGGLHSCFLFYGIFMNCLGYGVEWGAGLWMINFEGLKGSGRDLAEGVVAGQHSLARLEWRRELKSSPRMTHRACTSEPSEQAAGLRKTTTSRHSESRPSRELGMFTHCCFHRASQMLFRFPKKQEFCTSTNDLQNSRYFRRLDIAGLCYHIVMCLNMPCR
jgi:hypothetical protein